MGFDKKGYIAKVLVLYILLTGDILCNALAEDTDDNQFVYTGQFKFLFIALTIYAALTMGMRAIKVKQYFSKTKIVDAWDAPEFQVLFYFHRLFVRCTFQLAEPRFYTAQGWFNV